MKINIERSVTIITPSVGRDTLQRNIDSVKAQTYSNVKHLIVWDGVEPKIPVDWQIKLPWNVGANGFYGHRVYAAMSNLLDTDFVCLLDEDNFLEPDHVKSLMDTINSGQYDFAFSLRNIVDKEGNKLLEDNCESIGLWPVWGDEARGVHIDTSSYLFHSIYFATFGHFWHHGYAADRRFLNIVRNNGARYACTGKYTLNYRLDGNENSASLDFFKVGNERMKKVYDDRFPWVA